MSQALTAGASLDIRSLSQTREVVAYHHGGLFPVLTTAPDGSAVAVLRGGAGHLGLGGRIDIVRSRDAGLTWTQPQIVANSETDDRNPAFGASANGALILSYHRTFAYDADGNYTPWQDPEADWPCEVRITRSHDCGLTWEDPYLLSDPILRRGSPFGKIVALRDGTLLLPIYYRPVAPLVPQPGELIPGDSCSYLIRSRDDGRTWEAPSLICVNSGEPAVIGLPNGDVLAIVRREKMGKTLWSTRSRDGGFTWSTPVRITDDMQHPGDLLVLRDGSVLLAYGNRNSPPTRIEARLSRDGGSSWLPCLLLFSGSLLGYNAGSPHRADLGYPSSTLCGSRVVTMYYYHATIPPAADLRRAGNPAYDAGGYLAVAVTWEQDELFAALKRCAGLG
jgi:hypothetical protein